MISVPNGWRSLRKGLLKMTLEDLERMDCEFLPVLTVAEYLHSKEQHVRVSMRNGVPWGYVMGQADFRVPRRAFVNFHRHGQAVQMKEDK